MPERAAPVFPAIVSWTVPDPFPVPPLPMVIHEVLLTADHGHPDCVTTPAATPTAALGPTRMRVGETAVAHAVGEACCVITSTWPEIFTVPVR